uniref:BPTI/Kunitz inhibitor domain-containing protein n=1 Tax=Amblyomma maculatum TaxID=34609 RepID=G3MSV2_AMBMU
MEARAIISLRGLLFVVLRMKAQTCFLLALFCVIGALTHGLPNPEICNLDGAEGRCPGREPPYEGWYFDSRYGFCGPFKWDVCGGNRNHFENCTSCMQFCTRSEGGGLEDCIQRGYILDLPNMQQYVYSTRKKVNGCLYV